MRAVIHLLFAPSLGELRASARAELLAGSLQRRLGEPVKVEVAKSYEELEKRLIADEIHIAWAPPMLCAKAEPTARAILKAIRNGRSSYRSALVCRADEPLDAAKLSGKRVAWVDPLSTAGCVLPRSHLALLGQDRALASETFYGSYRDALQAVLTGAADVSAVYTTGGDEASVRASLATHVGGEAGKLKPIAYTGETPNDGLVFTAKLSVVEAERIVSALLPLTDGSRGPTMLLEVCDAQAFLRARPGDYRVLRLTK